MNILSRFFGNRNTLRNIIKKIWKLNGVLIEMCNEDLEEKDIEDLEEDINKIRRVNNELYECKQNFYKKLFPPTWWGKLKAVIFWSLSFYLSYMIVSLLSGGISGWDINIFVKTPLPLSFILGILVFSLFKIQKPKDSPEIKENCVMYMTNKDVEVELMNKINSWIPYLLIRKEGIKSRIELRIIYLKGKE